MVSVNSRIDGAASKIADVQDKATTTQVRRHEQPLNRDRFDVHQGVDRAPKSWFRHQRCEPEMPRRRPGNDLCGAWERPKPTRPNKPETKPDAVPLTPAPSLPPPLRVTPEQLKKVVPGLDENLAGNPQYAGLPPEQRAPALARDLDRAMGEANIDTPDLQAAFVAQLAHESDSFRTNEEYASGRDYEGRADLGNTQPGDGERFKGRGFIQLTGRANYDSAGKALGLDLVNHPEQAAEPQNAARIAAWYWSSHDLNRHSTNGSVSQGEFDQITRAINGGTNGKADRDVFFDRARGAID